MATMAVSCCSVACSMHVLPAIDGLRLQKSRAKIVPVPPQTSVLTLPIVADKKSQKRAQIVLTQDVTQLGKSGELLSVKSGYFRNYLLPFGKAKIATAELLKSIKLAEEKVLAEKKKVKEEAETIARQFQSIGFFNVRRKGGQGKQIFGSVTSEDVVEIILDKTGRKIDKRLVSVPEIRELGLYTVEIKLHPEVLAPVKVNVILG